MIAKAVTPPITLPIRDPSFCCLFFFEADGRFEEDEGGGGEGGGEGPSGKRRASMRTSNALVWFLGEKSLKGLVGPDQSPAYTLLSGLELRSRTALYYLPCGESNDTK